MAAKKKQTAKQVKAKVPCKTVSAVTAKKMGRPSKFTERLANEILDSLRQGTPLAQIARRPHMPSLGTIYNWFDATPELTTKLARAREDGFEMIAAEALRIADTQVEAFRVMTTKYGKKVNTHVTKEDAVAHRRLQVDTRLKLLACWNPSKYGSRISVDGEVKHNHAFPASFSSAMAVQEGAPNVDSAQTKAH